MDSDGVETTFGDLIDAGVLSIGDGYRAKNVELGGDGPIFLRAGHVSDTHIDFADVERFHADLEPKLLDKMSQIADVIVTTKGNSTGRTSYVTVDMPQFVYSPHLSRWRSLDLDAICPGFLRYWSRSREFSVQLDGMKASTDMAPYLSLRDQRMLRITMPSIEEQRAIAEVLGSLDDKIELNRRVNRTLEQMAAAIFKAWFVESEPVKAKAAGATSFPTIPQPVFDALPTEFTDSPLGPIPKGWRVGSPLELADLLSGGTPKSSEPSYWNGDVPWASAKDVSQCGDAFLIKTERCITQLGLAKSSTKLIEPFSTVVVARGATTGRFTMFGGRIAMNQTCYALRSKANHHFFTYCWFASIRERLVQTAHGSVFDTITTSTFKTESVLLPTRVIMASFGELVQPFFEYVLSNLRQNATLAAIRDALLPKLLSGEIRVGAAEKMVGEVA